MCRLLVVVALAWLALAFGPAVAKTEAAPFQVGAAVGEQYGGGGA